MRQVLWFCVVLATAAYICGPIVDPDLWWHITVGRWILAFHEIPVVDHWNMFGAGQPWRAYSWPLEIVFAAAEQLGDMHGLYAVKLALAVAVACSLAWVSSRLAGDWFVGLLLGIFATLGCFNHFTLRPQSLVWVYLALVLLLADEVEQRGWTVRRGALLALVMMAWANTHITTALGIGVAVAWVAAAGWRTAGLTLASMVLGTLVTPYFGGEWLTFFSKTGHPLMLRSIAEFQPATIMQHSTAFLVIAAALVGMGIFTRPRVLDLFKLLAGGGTLLGALAVVKFLPFAVIVLTALIAVMWRRGGKAGFGNLGEGIHRLRKVAGAIPAEGAAFLLLCTVIVNVWRVWQAPLNTVEIPVSAVDFIEARQLPHPVLNDFGRGGYLMYRFSDERGVLEHKVPIDGRTNVMPKEVWEKAHRAFTGREEWREYIELVKPRTILWKRASPLTAILLNDDAYCVIFRSGTSEVGFAVFVERAWFLAHGAGLQSDNCR